MFFLDVGVALLYVVGVLVDVAVVGDRGQANRSQQRRTDPALSEKYRKLLATITDRCGQANAKEE